MAGKPVKCSGSRNNYTSYTRKRECLEVASKNLPNLLQEYIYLINQAQGPYWENIGPSSWQYGPSAARSVQKRPRADILPVRYDFG